MTELEVLQLFKNAGREIANADMERVGLDTDLSDLDLTSVEVLEIIGALEQQLSIRLHDEDLAKLTTVKQLAALIQRMKSG